MGGMFGSQLLGLASSAISILLGVILIVVGLTQVRRASPLGGLCLAGAGALNAFGTLVSQVVHFTLSLTGFGEGMTVLTATQLLTSLLHVVAAVLVPVGIFMIAGDVKRGSAQQNSMPNPY